MTNGNSQGQSMDRTQSRVTVTQAAERMRRRWARPSVIVADRWRYFAQIVRSQTSD